MLKRLLESFSPGSAAQGAEPLERRTCTICAYQGFFGAFGRPPRLDAQCPQCGSLERHRFQWMYLGETELQRPILHAAAETALERKLRQRYASDYRTSDLLGPADLRLDLEKIDLPDASVGTVICNHVLEHLDDRKALREIHRILQKGGKLVCSVPIVWGWETTYEDPTITSAHERELHFGQDDHVRFYGRDFVDRLREADFSVDEWSTQPRDCVTYSLQRGDKFFVGTK
jgi:SAM-dependent methyltransferase